MSDEQPGSPSPDRAGFRSRLKPRIRKQTDNSSVTSLTSNEGPLGEPLSQRSSTSERRSTDTRLKPPSSEPERRNSGDSSTGRRLSNLVRKSSRRKKKKDAGLIPGSEFGGRDAVGIDSGDDRSNGKMKMSRDNGSTDSVGRAKSAGSSLLTEDEDDSASSSRPTLVSRKSHTGYLTFSSPLIATETLDASETTSHSADPAIDQPPPLPTSQSPPRKNNPLDRVRGINTPSSKPSFSDLGDIIESPASYNSEKSTGSDREKRDRPGTAQSAKPSLRSISTTSVSSDPPATFVTPPTPVVPQHTPSGSRHTKGTASVDSVISEPPAAIVSGNAPHRRTRSVTNTKIDRINTLPPTAEEIKTPGGTLFQPTGSGGFFSSVFSATTNAVTQVSNALTNPATFGGQRSRSGTGPGSGQKVGFSGDEEVIIPGSDAHGAEEDASSQQQEAAIKTLGQGNLSLSHLGIDLAPEPADTMSINGDMGGLGRQASVASKSRSSTHTEEANAIEAVASAYAPKAGEADVVPVIEDNSSTAGRPRSLGSVGTAQVGNATPPREAEMSSLNRAGSVRSRISEKKRRIRGGSAPSGSAIAAALGQSHAAIANPGNLKVGRRPTGFAVANTKRNKEYHALFRSVPEDDYLIDDYSAALQREILLHGRMYVSEKHVCFSSNIFGWVTNLVISFDEIVAIEKKSTAVVFPNAIVIQTLHAKNVFASFMNRDSTYDLLIGIWRVGHPNLKNSDNGFVLDESASDEKAQDMDDEDESDDEESDDDDDDDDTSNGTDDAASARAASMTGSEAADTVRVASTRMPTAGTIAASAPSNAPQRKATESRETSPVAAGTAAPLAVNGQDFPGPATHAPTECSDGATHYDKQALDDTVAAPLGKVYSMMFGPQSGGVMKRFLADMQKCTDIHLTDDKKGMDHDNKTYSYDYIKPLFAPVGPKQTKCNVSQTLDAFDLEKAVSVTCTTSTPDVPSGNAFVVKTRYCLTWAAGNATRINMTAAVEWSGKSWLKGPIEKGAADGQLQHGQQLAEFLNKQLSSRSPVKGPKGKVKGKKKRGAAGGQVNGAADAGSSKKSGGAASHSGGWGPLETIRPFVEPVGDIVSSFVSLTVVLGVALSIVTVLWLRLSWKGAGNAVTQASGSAGRYSMFSGAQRLAAYEELWRAEESQLWDWLEDRLAMDSVPIVGGGYQAGGQRQQRFMGGAPKSSGGVAGGDASSGAPKVADSEQRMSDRQMDDAIRVTEERLSALKAVVDKRRSRDYSPVDAEK